MYLHLRIPGFHAAVHQAIAPALRKRPVAVAVDAAPTAALVAASIEARAAAVWPGMRADHARRRCPGLTVVVQEPERYAAAQRCVTGLCAAWTPQVAGSPGRCDLDLAGTDALWRQRLDGAAGAAPEDLAQRIAAALRERCRETLHLGAVVGGAPRLVAARLAAVLARDARACPGGVMVFAGEAGDAVDALPVSRLDGCPPALRALLAQCGVTTIGALRALGADELGRLVGPPGADLHRLLHGEDAPVAAETDPEPSVRAGLRTGPDGADPTAARALLAALAREIGWQLRQRGSACAHLTLVGRWLDGRQVESGSPHAQTTHDGDLAGIALRLFTRVDTRRVHWARLRLTATRLGPAEQQTLLFGPAPATRLEAARDRLRRRFGADLVRPATAPTTALEEV